MLLAYIAEEVEDDVNGESDVAAGPGVSISDSSQQKVKKATFMILYIVSCPISKHCLKPNIICCGTMHAILSYQCEWCHSTYCSA